ncbi:MAG: SRPBCC domain-containing protein [Actinomycetota bacterium]|nr:SRPBCC domain-containing protein [Actinomycetota bacterium]
MDGIATRVFSFATPARPDQVWAALTRPGLTRRYLYGLAAESDWRPGGGASFVGASVSLVGDVLAAEEPGRLSYSVRAGDGQPDTYVTWEIMGDGSGSVVRLYVDEPGQPEVESAWVEVVSRLEATLASVFSDSGAPISGADRDRSSS